MNCLHLFGFSLAIFLLGCAQPSSQSVQPGKGKVLLVIAPAHFRDEELFHTKEELEKAGFGVDIASTSKQEAVGIMGGRVTPNFLVGEANLSNYRAVVFIGGPGVEEYNLSGNNSVLALARQANASGKVIGAICIAPRILAKADVIRGKKLTSFPDQTSLSFIAQAGGNYTGAKVEQDGLLITAEGPASAHAFGQKLVAALIKD